MRSLCLGFLSCLGPPGYGIVKSHKDEPLQRTRREVRDLDSSPRSANEGAEGLSGDPGFTRGWRIEEKEEQLWGEST